MKTRFVVPALAMVLTGIAAADQNELPEISPEQMAASTGSYDPAIKSGNDPAATPTAAASSPDPGTIWSPKGR